MSISVDVLKQHHLEKRFLLEFMLSLAEALYDTDHTTPRINCSNHLCTNVLHYLLNQTKIFPLFIGNRVQFILDYFSAEGWRFIDTKCSNDFLQYLISLILL